MPVVTVELNVPQDMVDKPLIWRLGKLFNVVTNIRCARVTEDYGYVALEIEGSTNEVDQALAYLTVLGLIAGRPASSPQILAVPEAEVPQPNTIYVRLSTVYPEQGRASILSRISKDFTMVVNIERAALDEEGGYVEVALSGPLAEVQRAISYLHTTGIHVNPRQRSVTDYSNL